jgi:hypothetical protein
MKGAMTMARDLLQRGLVALVLATAGLSAFGQLPVSDTPGLVWSKDVTSETKESAVKFHGEFSKERVTATLDNLPEHDYVQISVQLLILRCRWRGVWGRMCFGWGWRMGGRWCRPISAIRR